MFKDRKSLVMSKILLKKSKKIKESARFVFCDTFESIDHESTSSLTLEKHTENVDNNYEVCSVSQINTKLSERYETLCVVWHHLYNFKK